MKSNENDSDPHAGNVLPDSAKNRPNVVVMDLKKFQQNLRKAAKKAILQELKRLSSKSHQQP